MIRRPARAASRGFTVIEFVIASTLTLALLVTVSVATSSLQRSMAKNRLKSELSVAAANTFEKSRAFNCGAAVNPIPASNPALDSTDRISTVCSERVFPGAGNTRGDLDWQFKANAINTTVDAKFSTGWRQSTAGAGKCYDPAGAAVGERTQPSLLVRRLEFTWTIFGTTQTAVFEDVESFPSVRDIYNEGLGGVVVRVPTNSTTVAQMVTVQRVGDPTSSAISRRALPCTQGAPSTTTSIWFPYLPYGEYSVAIKGTSTSQTVTVSKTAPVSEIGLGGA